MNQLILRVALLTLITSTGCMNKNRPRDSTGAPSTPAAAGALSDRDWMLVSLNGNAILADRPPILRFEDGQVTGFGGVNRISSSYKHDGRQLKFGQVISTRMAGDPVLMRMESSFLRALDSVDGYRVDGDELTLTDDKVIVAVFRAGKSQGERI
jgi:heat shock protein HslJ